MRMLDQLRWVQRSLGHHRQRNALAVLGIAIGIMAVSLLTAVGEGVRLYLLESFSQFGTRIIAITPGKTQTQSLAGLLSSIKPLSLADSEALRSLPYVEQVVPVVSGTGPVEAGRYTRHTNVLGVGHEGARAWRIRVALGRFLPRDDPGSARNYAVLGSRLREELFGQRSPIGAWVRVGGSRFRVLGVMESKGQLLGFDLDDAVYIPASRALQLFNRDSLMEVDVVFSRYTTSAQMAERIRKRLIARHRVEDFTLFTQEDMLGSLNRILGLLTLTVASLGGISLLVGGVGILTIMTTALQERRPEIGLLCALGATRRQIAGLFLAEAAILSVVGGLVGIGGMALLVGAGRLLLPALPLVLHGGYLLLALLLAALIGVASGLVPALRAARLDPIASLRAE